MSLKELKIIASQEATITNTLPEPIIYISTGPKSTGRLVHVNPSADLLVKDFRRSGHLTPQATIFEFLPNKYTRSNRDGVNLCRKVLVTARHNEQNNHSKLPERLLIEDNSHHSYAVYPQVIRKNGRVIGLRASISDRTYEIKALRNEKQKAKRLERLRKENVTLLQTAELLNTTHDLKSLQENIGKIFQIAISSDTSNIMVIKGKNIRVSMTWGYKERNIPEPLGTSPEYKFKKMRTFQKMSTTGNPIRIPDTHADKRWVMGKDKRRKRWRSYMGVPIFAEGVLLGFLNFNARRKKFFTRDHEKVAVGLANQFGGALQRANLYEKLVKLSETDAVTGLPNRRESEKRLKNAISTALRSGKNLSIVFYDLDDFGAWNKIEGEEVGDKVLRISAKQAKKKIRHTDTIGRWGGEEWVVIPSNNSRRAGFAIAKKIKEGFEELPPFNIKIGGTSEKHKITWRVGQKVKISATFGIASLKEITPPDKKLSFDARIDYYKTQLITLADNRVKRGKRKGKDTIIK